MGLAMRVVFVSRSFQVMSRNSDSDLIWPLLRQLATKGIEVLMLAQKSRSGRDYIERDGVKVHFINQSLGAPTSGDFQEGLGDFLFKLHSEEPIDIVHVFDSSANYILQMKKLLKFKVVLDVDALQLSRLFSILSFNKQTALSHISVGIRAGYHFIRTYFGADRDLLRVADGVLVSSPQQRFFLERYYMYPDSRIHVVPRAFTLPTETLEPLELAQINKKLAQHPDAKIILNVTDMSQPEETTQLLKAFERLAVKTSSCYLIIIGNGPGFKEIEFQLYNLALGSRAFMLGALGADEISKWIMKSHAFVDLSSLYRQFESYAIEAMLRCKVVVASELGPLSHVIEDGSEGYLVRPADALSLQLLLEKILAGGSAIEAITQNALSKASEVFAPGRAVDVMVKVYDQILRREARK